MNGSEISIASPEEPPRSLRNHILMGLGILTALSLAGALGWRIYAEVGRAMPLPPMSSAEAMAVSRRVDVAVQDAEKTWSGWFRARKLTPPDPANVVLYTQAQSSPCAGAEATTGPFYCPVDNTAAFDIGFLHALELRMQDDSEMGTALVVARVIASHIQNTLEEQYHLTSEQERQTFDHSLQADCLAGVWAGMAAARLGPIPEGFYSEVIKGARSINEQHDLRPGNDQPNLNPFYFEPNIEREASFRIGYTTLDPTLCPEPRYVGEGGAAN